MLFENKHARVMPKESGNHEYFPVEEIKQQVMCDRLYS
jgi:hypothetical protein